LEPGPVEVLDDVPECHSDDECEIDEVCLGEECVALESDDCGYFENHAWISYECCDDSACGEGFVCVGNECVEVPDEETPVPPPYVHEPSDTPVVEVEGVEQPLPQCCLLGICGGIGALCWYWIVLIFMLLALALAAVTIYKKLEKPKKR